LKGRRAGAKQMGCRELFPWKKVISENVYLRSVNQQFGEAIAYN
jgi:hypothetical protein